MSPIQQMLLGVGAVATKTYVDDVFSTYVYTGNGSARSINNGIDLSGEGGMVWIKKRNSSTGGNSHIADTARGITKYLTSNENYAELTDANRTSATTSQGFSLGTVTTVNNNNDTYASWTFRKQKGFCDIVTVSLSSYSTNQRISHSLGCIPGLILLKNTNNAEDWRVYHRSLGRNKYITLNEAYSANSSTDAWGTADPTSTDFGFNTTNLSSGMPSTYVAYVFAGGESTAATATSVDFTNTGSGQGQVRGGTAGGALEFGTGDFTIECWVKPTNLGSNLEVLFDSGNNGGNASDSVYFGFNQSEVFLKSENAYYNQASTTNNNGQWMHVAACRSGTNLRIFKNGTLLKTTTNSTDLKSGSNLFIIGKAGNINGDLTGLISNFRAIKGQALYTSSFRPSTEPLTTTSQGATASNVKLLCCQGSTPSAATVSPYTLSAYYATASTDSPFDDPAAFTFGDAGDQNVIKCGSYVGNGNADGPEIFCSNGWEPQLVMVKASSFANEHWHMFDSMRGIVSGGNDKWLYPNLSNAEPTAAERIDLTSTGFKIQTNRDELNKDGETFIWMAIRRPDGYVGKPPELGTGVFAMDTGAGDTSTTIPNYDSGFPVDFALSKQPASTSDWYANGRLIGTKELSPNKNTAEDSSVNYVWDSNLGWGNGAWQDSSYQSWMWKRHAGFDVVAYEGNGVSGRQISHSLNKTVEMIWIKKRDGTTDWNVGHKGLNGGTNPWDYSLVLNSTEAEADSSNKWNDTAPTSTHFTVGDSGRVNTNTSNYIAMLFASVDGISKVGSYSGQSSTITITTGFSPRFIFVKMRSPYDGFDWWVFDTLRGWGTGNDQSSLRLNLTNAQESFMDWGGPTSTGFTMVSDSSVNGAGREYIYYAQA